MTEIRSYRRVFDLERRIYMVDRVRLNPSGIPVRGIAYAAVALLTATGLSRAPLLGGLISVVPWYVRDLVVPGAAGVLLTLIRLEGRSFHSAAAALIGYAMSPRRLTAMRRGDAVGASWSPGSLLSLPDGSEAGVLPVRYRGPGIVTLAAHAPERVRRSRLSRRRVAVVEMPGRAGSTARLIVLGKGAVLACLPHERRSR